jgi:hypothetical protein
MGAKRSKLSFASGEKIWLSVLLKGFWLGSSAWEWDQAITEGCAAGGAGLGGGGK